MTDQTPLHPGALSPALTAAFPGGRTLRLPDAVCGHFSGILFHCGSWCPYCNAQLRAFQRSLDRLTGLGVLVTALSVDDEATGLEDDHILVCTSDAIWKAKDMRPRPPPGGQRQLQRSDRHPQPAPPL